MDGQNTLDNGYDERNSSVRQSPWLNPLLLSSSVTHFLVSVPPFDLPNAEPTTNTLQDQF